MTSPVEGEPGASSGHEEATTVPIYFHETIDASIVREKTLAYLEKVGRAVTEHTNVCLLYTSRCV